MINRRRSDQHGWGGEENATPPTGVGRPSKAKCAHRCGGRCKQGAPGKAARVGHGASLDRVVAATGVAQPR